MIIATIGRHKFIVASMQDAESLLHILERANPVEDEYCQDCQEYRTYYRPSDQVDVGIEITRRELVTAEEHADRASKARERARAASTASLASAEPAHG